MSVAILIVRCLEDEGPMAAVELAAQLGQHRNAVARHLGRLRQHRPEFPRSVHVAAWAHDAEGSRKYLRPIYAAGDLPDAKKPVVPPRERQQAYCKKRYVQRLKAASVFTLGEGYRTTLKRARKPANAEVTGLGRNRSSDD